jgi:FlaA1/EpsC-like NDP-sugar epimerase/lipopolysaccharide/colanic/teichoic acid biosynthesis glycosyltransferase
VLVGSVALLGASAPILVGALFVRLVNGAGPWFIRIPSAGLGGRRIEILKLRTVRVDPTGGTVSPADHEPGLGRSLRVMRIDEFPKLWNVVRGDLSLVGPRPESIETVDLTDPRQLKVLSVRPGVTGLAQLDVRFTSVGAPVGGTDEHASVAARLRLDCYYVEHRSARLDAAILARTVGWMASRWLDALLGGLRPSWLSAAGTPLRQHALERLGRLRGRHLLGIDVVTAVVGVVAALVLRSDADVASVLGQNMALLLAVVVARTLINIGLRLYSRLWRYAGPREYLSVVAATVVGSGASMITYQLFVAIGLGSTRIPGSVWVVEALFSLVSVAAPRVALRLASQAVGPVPNTPTRLRTLLYGAGSVGTMMAQSALQEPRAGLVPVGFLDDDPARQGQSVAGLPVFGDTDVLADAVTLTGAQVLLITMPSAAGPTVRRVTEAGWAADLEVRTVPAIHELLDGSINAYRVRRVRVEDLIRRPEVVQVADRDDRIVRDRVVLVTGAAGSIGSELARQVLAMAPRQLILVDRAESPLYSLHRELEAQPARDTEISIQLANVVSHAAMTRLIGAGRPDVIFHAAALKHVPLMESHTSEAIQVNVGGTRAVLDAAVAAGTSTFVLVSTDKAVIPSSTMGATKRLAEWLVADVGRTTGRGYVSVRFGNVLGSTGSVVPIFQEQLEAGRPLTITHPEMTRYFMTIPEASSLIIAAAEIGTAGDVFVLDMGQPISIVDLARDFIRLAGRDPETVPIVYTGIRPGEKLHEVLFYEHEGTVPTQNPKVMLARGTPPPDDIRAIVADLLSLADGEHDELARARLFEAVAEPLRTADAQPTVLVADGAAAVRPRIDPVAAGATSN